MPRSKRKEVEGYLDCMAKMLSPRMLRRRNTYLTYSATALSTF
jgi:hypothetical protein